MCGRFEIHSDIEIIAAAFDIRPEDAAIGYRPNYNVAPTDDVIVIIRNGRKKLLQYRWGLIPSWAREEKIAFSTINARAETVAEKPAYRDAFRKQRCLVIADGFYEFKAIGKVKKPFYIHLRSGRQMAFAGLYSNWTSPDGKKIDTCTIIVTTANELLAPIHDRMPVILDQDAQEKWLDPALKDSAALLALLKPCSSEELELYEVSQKVNSVRNNTPDLIQPIPNEE